VRVCGYFFRFQATSSFRRYINKAVPSIDDPQRTYLAAARNGADVLLLDRDAIGRGGATVMAQLSVAAALALEEPDDWQTHVEDTLTAGRGICRQDLTEMLSRQSPDRVLELDAWRIGWARTRGRLSQIETPGHSRARCCYVDT
jgi:succinate dehydrogenase/fumarate reductase flavoprotein subunit